jgi:hypothetical protein
MHRSTLAVAAALAVLLAGSTRTAADAASEVGNPWPAALLDSPQGEPGPAVAPSDLGPEEGDGQRLLNLSLALPMPPPAPSASELRRAKCAYLWARVAPWSYSKGLCGFFVNEHERIGLGSDWYYSFCNAAHASGLNPRMSFRKGGMWARGLMDCTQRNGPRSAFRDLGSCDLFKPKVSIRNHCLEMNSLHRQSRREGWSLQRAVFLPRSPDGWRARREQRKWQAKDRAFRAIMADWYSAQPKERCR